MKKICLGFSIILSMLLTGCASNVSPNVYTAAEVGVTSKVVPGTILAKRAVTIEANSKAGGMAGVTAGAAAGSTVGGSPAANVVGAVGGAVVGGLLGNAADKSFNRHKAVEYIIRLDSGNVISITQTSELNFQVHQRFLIIYGAMTRIIPNDLPTSTKR